VSCSLCTKGEPKTAAAAVVDKKKCDTVGVAVGEKKQTGGGRGQGQRLKKLRWNADKKRGWGNLADVPRSRKGAEKQEKTEYVQG